MNSLNFSLVSSKIFSPHLFYLLDFSKHLLHTVYRILVSANGCIVKISLNWASALYNCNNMFNE